MTYVDFSKKKTLFIIGLSVILLFLVNATFTAKKSHYGETPFHHAVGWVAYKMMYGAWYNIRAIGLPDAHATERDTAEALPVLVYHSVKSESEEINFDRNSFAEHMFALKEAGWQTITLDEFQKFIHGEISLPKRSLLLTFDDGAKDSYHPVDPLLNALDFNAVSYILPKFSAGEGTHYYLSSNEIEQMLNSGRWEIGSHGNDLHEYRSISDYDTRAPALVNRVWIEEQGRLETEREYVLRVTDDLVSAKLELEDRFRVPISSFAFPFGEFGQLSVNIPNANSVIIPITTGIHESSFHQWWEGEGLSYNYPQEDPSGFYKRISPEVGWSGEQLVTLLEEGLPKELPYTATLTESDGWIRNWGSITYENNTLQLKPSPGSTGGTVFLDGSGHWEDYLVTATFSSPEHTGASIFVRFTDRENYALCNFGKNFLHIEQFVSGEHRVIKGLRQENLLPEDSYEAQVRVEGRKISCGINGETLVSTEFLDPSLSKGGIGLKTWDANFDTATLILTALQVIPIP